MRPVSQELAADTLVQFLVTDSLANVFCPACKLWNTGHGATMMREAVSLMGGYGITEDCPGFLGQKWTDAQLEATYEGPEAVQRRQLSITMTNELFLAQFRQWIKDMRGDRQPAPGDRGLHPGERHGALALDPRLPAEGQGRRRQSPLPLAAPRGGLSRSPMPSAGCSPRASRSSTCSNWKRRARRIRSLAEGLAGFVNFFSDLCHVQAARAAGEVGRICAELVYGYNRHPDWCRDAMEICFQGEQLDALECIMPGIAGYGRAMGRGGGGRHATPRKPAPARPTSLQTFMLLRQRLDICLTGARLAKDRAATAVSKVMIPEALDYPA